LEVNDDGTPKTVTGLGGTELQSHAATPSEEKNRYPAAAKVIYYRKNNPDPHALTPEQRANLKNGEKYTNK